MAASRKLQGEIERCLKKVTEGVETFEDIWQKVHNATNSNQKEKYEADLKKEIKKLQRLRDQIKSWIASAEIKDKSTLLEFRKLIETQMERFKVVERETKTKAYSKEGLGAAQKMDPAQKEREEISAWLIQSIDALNLQQDQFESEIESLLAGKKKRLDKDKQDRMDELKAKLEKHRYHIRKLETLLRMLDNMSVEVGQIRGIKDDVEYYIESSQEPDFEGNEYLYDDIIGLEDVELSGVGQPSSATTDSNGTPTSLTSSPPPSPPLSTTGGGTTTTSTGTGHNHSSDSSQEDRRRPSDHLLQKVVVKPMAVRAGGGSTGGGSSANLSSSLGVGTGVGAVGSGVNTSLNCSSGSLKNNSSLSSLSKMGGGGGSLSGNTSFSIPNNSSPSSAPLPLSLLTSQPPPSNFAAVAAQHHKHNTSVGGGQENGLPNEVPPPTSSSTPVPPSSHLHNSTSGGSCPSSAAPSPAPCPPTTSPPPPRPSPILPPPPSLSIMPPSNPGPGQQQDKSLSTLKSIAQQVIDRAGLEIPSSTTDHTSRTGFETSSSKSNSGLGGGGCTGEAHIPPLLGVAPLGPVPLQKEHQCQFQMMEAAFYHMPHPADTERVRQYLPRHPCVTPVYYHQVPLPHSDTLEFFQRLSTETLFFIFYYMEGSKAQYLAAKALKKQSWRFHTKYMMWFQRHEEPKLINEEYEQGTYIYFDYEKWGQRKKEGFTFEYKYLEDRDLN